jgi:hypothetical protein
MEKKQQQKLTLAQLNQLKPYERHFDTMLLAGYSSYPGQAAIDKMCAVWKELTGKDYPLSRGCSACISNLVKDLGTLYRAQRPMTKGGRK